MKQEMKLLLKQDMIKGFSYSFARALFEKLKKLDREDKIFSIGKEKAEDLKRKGKFTDIAKSIITYLKEQVMYDEIDVAFGTPEEIASFIGHTEEFLAIFEESVIN